ncbi:MFS transporter [Actinomadura madurae]|uniref:Drug resistance transporter, EmrB/QacA subfamily n=1 Tax=Actinomadura madurae TaxID=1993 RepID=A0A1I5M713_9ACTN|nr:MFS transporter [Actinomadura madurae]SFP04801.1 drug resistance transporter, EmrB/QacA subfamily [Actinomadura madurae]SPT52332.1 Spectinomycin tetracycline efflux pump [Actinomadura madurae]
MTATAAGRRAAVAVLCVVQFMVVLDSTITTVALDAIRVDLATDEHTLQYVLSLYAAAFGGLLLFAGRATDLAGGRRIFVAGATTFTAASLLCAVAGTMPVLLAGRSVQGAGAAFASAAAFALLLDLYPEGPGRNRVLGVWAALGASGAAAGLILGGLLTDLAGWHLIFAINVPPGTAAAALALRLLPTTPSRPAGRLDVPGAATATLGTSTLLFALTRGQTGGWTEPGTMALLTCAAVLLLTFCVVEARSPDPLVPLPTLTRGPLPVAAIAIASLMAVVGSQGFFLVLYLQRIMGLGPTATGLAIAPSAFLALAGTVLAARLAARIPARALVVTGLLLVAAAQALLGNLPVNGSYVRDVLPALLLFGLGLGTAFVGATIAGTTGLAPAEEGRASGLLNASQQLGIAVGVATLVSATAVTSTLPQALASSYANGLRLGALVAVAAAITTAATTRLTAPTVHQQKTPSSARPDHHPTTPK